MSSQSMCQSTQNSSIETKLILPTIETMSSQSLCQSNPRCVHRNHTINTNHLYYVITVIVSEQPKICLRRLDYQPSRPCHHSQCVRATQNAPTKTILIIPSMCTMSSQSLCQNNPRHVYINWTTNYHTTNHLHHVVTVIVSEQPKIYLKQKPYLYYKPCWSYPSGLFRSLKYRYKELERE